MSIKQRYAIYAGSFDPVTFGHLAILKKAVDLFEKVYVLVAQNHSKKHFIPQAKRIDLMKKSIDADRSLPKNIEVLPLGVEETVANKALELNVNFLIRGLRGHTDLDDELVNARINKEINNNLETVIFVPEVDLEELSSSIVRSVVGLRGWKEILKNRVPSIVINQLQEKWLKEKMNLEDNDWFNIKQKLDRPYHNLKHSIDFIDVLYYNIDNEIDKRALLWAAVYHDLYEDVDTSVVHCFVLCPADVYSRAKELILATDHSKELTQEQLKDKLICSFVSWDLAILGKEWSFYEAYKDNVRKEYKIYDEEWRKGRIEFLKKMLEKPFIYPDVIFRDEFETRARENMKKELDLLRK